MEKKNADEKEAVKKYTDEEIDQIVENKIQSAVCDLTAAGSPCFATCA